MSFSFLLVEAATRVGRNCADRGLDLTFHFRTLRRRTHTSTPVIGILIVPIVAAESIVSESTSGLMSAQSLDVE